MTDILILAALREEIAKIRRIEGVTIALTGDGALRAARGAAVAMERTRPRFVVGVGIAGALTTDLERGDLVVARTIVDENGGRTSCDAGLVSAVAAGGARPGTIVTSRAIASSAGKRKLAAGIDGPAAVDLESAAWQRAAAERSLPFVSVRCILDPASEDLPDLLKRCLRADGSISRARVVLQTALHPLEIRTLFDLRRRTATAAAILGRCMESLTANLHKNG
jgi:nucleoside phosphorylase